MTVTYHVGDTREVIKSIADGSVDLIASSPPFLALRSYVPAGHESKGDEIGSERNPAEFIDMLLGLTAEWGRVLAAHGSIAIELGDTYSGSGGAGGDYNEGGLRDKAPKFTGSAKYARTLDPDIGAHPISRVSGTAGAGGGPGWPRAKSLALIPQLYATSLAYGRNILRSGLTARQLLDFMERIEENLPDLTASELLTMARQWIPQAEAIQHAEFQPWLVRNVIVWHRPNPAVGALGDKVRPSTSYIVIATRSPKRWFDLTAVRTAFAAGNNGGGSGLTDNGTGDVGRRIPDRLMTHAGAPPLDAWFDEYDGSHDTWTLTTQPSRLAHYAMWPAKLAERLILMMCPREVCRVCGEPRRRIETSAPSCDGIVGKIVGFSNGLNATHGNYEQVGGTFATRKTTLGWTDCGCRSVAADGLSTSDASTYRPGVTLDPFAGSGTTLAVADLHGRDAIGIDFDARNKAIYPARYDEVKRALYGTPAPMPGQGDLFAEVV